jgi:hypothetical protein
LPPQPTFVVLFVRRLLGGMRRSLATGKAKDAEKQKNAAEGWDYFCWDHSGHPCP